MSFSTRLRVRTNSLTSVNQPTRNALTPFRPFQSTTFIMRSAVILVALVAAAPLAAQEVRPTSPSAADLAIAQGRLDDAEQLLFAASSRATHEPSARGALGIFLASRGKLKIGAVLLEAARRLAAGHAPAHSSADSVTVALEPNDLTGLGRIAITVGRATLQADIDPNI